MEYKFILELLRSEMYEEFYTNLHAALIPFLKPEKYGRSVLENCSFLVSSAHEDKALHGQGFIARLSGSTAEFMHIWLLMNLGKDPFAVNAKGELTLTFKPALAGALFTKKESTVVCRDEKNNCKSIKLPKNSYAFNLFGTTLIVYHNPRRRNTFGENKPSIKEMRLTYSEKKQLVVISAGFVSGAHARAIRDGKVKRIDVFFG